MDSIRKWLMAIAGACFALTHTMALAQDTASYPSKPVRIIVPFAAGGATDIMIRIVAQQLSEAWKQSVVVENRPGGSAMIGGEAVVKSPADGYTYLAGTISQTANVSLFPNAPYKLLRDLQSAAILGLIPLVPVVQADSPIKSLHDLVAVSKTTNLNAGSSGNGTSAHLGLELFKGVTGAKLQHIPYKGGAPAMVDLLGGRIDVIFALLPECLPHLKSGKLRPLAVTSEKRHPLLPDVPTTSEVGIPGIEVTSWNGLMVPAGTSKDVVAKINAEAARIVEMPDVRARLIDLGFQPVAMSVSDAEKFVRTDIERWAKVIREANITPD